MPGHNHGPNQDDVLNFDAHRQELIKDIDLVPSSVKNPCDKEERHAEQKQVAKFEALE